MYRTLICKFSGTATGSLIHFAERYRRMGQESGS
jgi:hypothetical protein